MSSKFCFLDQFQACASCHVAEAVFLFGPNSGVCFMSFILGSKFRRVCAVSFAPYCLVQSLTCVSCYINVLCGPNSGVRVGDAGELAMAV